MNDELLKKLMADLEKSGFGSEMLVLKKFLDAGWRASGSRAYKDRDQKKTREIDVTAALQKVIRSSDHQDGKDATCWFHIVAEVKRARAPWIVFKRPGTSARELGIGWMNVVFRDGVRGHPAIRPITSALSNGLATRIGWIAHGVHEALKDVSRRSRWYSASVSVCKAAEFALKQNSWEVDKDSDTKPSPHLFFVQPVIVLDGLLVSAELDSNANIVLEEVPFATLAFEFASKKYTRGRYHVDLVTLRSLQAYIQICEKRLSDLLDALLTASRME